MNNNDIKNWNILGNELNFITPSERTDEKIKQSSKDKGYDSLSNINWETESDYHNTYYLGKGKYGKRELRMNNKLWHEKNK